MPKIIENVREKAIAEARRELLEDGYDGMTMRRVAAELGIGLGTVYNYFPSKEYLAAGVMLEDWQDLMRDFEAQPAGADARAVIRRLFDLVKTFTGRFLVSWKQYAEHGSALSMRRRYHSVLVTQLEKYIAAALPEETGKEKPWLSAFLAELILRFASDGESGYGAVEPAVNALLS